MVSMEEVFEAIREEREYQDKLWGPTQEGGDHSIIEFILFMEDYLQEARGIVSRIAAPKSNEDATHIIRKIATMCVACMEQNGIQRRNMKDLDKSCELHGVKCDEDE